MDLPSQYKPKDVESKWYTAWESSGFFTPKIEDDLPPEERFTIVIPPPNVTGILHMGHALNNSIQDILIRFERMRQKSSLWVPGVDHAGIATQNVVEKKLAKENKSRHSLGRDKFIEEVWKWKEDHGSTIVKQLRRLGASCDWSRERFTMDEGLSRAVRESFVALYEKDLIYQGDYIINWCPRCQTALSDEEAAHKETEGALYHIQYPLADNLKEHLVVATTRPETMLGDTAVAVNPNDERYKHLIGKTVILPLLERKIPVIADEFVDMDFGTGIVKITPAHDPNDFQFQSRHPEIQIINILNPNGTVNEAGGPYKNLDRFEARKKIVHDLEALGLFAKRVSHKHAVGHCYRCDTVVEPYLSKQWFVRMKPLAEKAIRVYKEGKTQFFPERWNKVYLGWLENIRDWCISRQIWWGHQIPVWYCENKCKKPIVTREDPKLCPECGSSKLKRDPDVLDTWFSSWLWPFSTLGWPEKTKDLKYFYPTSVLVTAPEIIFFWVARMIMAGLFFMGKEPFSRIYIHGTVRTDSGQKMSKSLGNAIDPLTVIDDIGADALRFSVIMLTASGQDAYLSKEKFELGRNFTNKIWNASRFVLTNVMHLKEIRINPEALSITDRWILTELQKTIEEMTKMIEQFRFNDAASTVYHFFWHSFCDWYLELAKPAFMGDEGEARAETTRSVLVHVLENSLRLLHPFMPFVTEEIWQKLKTQIQDPLFEKPSIMIADWPTVSKSFVFKEESEKFALFQEAVSSIRDLQALLGIATEKSTCVTAVSESGEILTLLQNLELSVKRLTRVAEFNCVPQITKVPGMVGRASSGMEIFVTGIKQDDLKVAETKTRKKIDELTRYIDSIEKKLSNESFVARAPEEVVEEEKQKKENAAKELKAYEENLAILTGQ